MDDFNAFLETLKTHIVLSDCIGQHVSWDKRKSRPTKGDHWSCCPFHSEKSSSFHVDDTKGYYYCFGCHESGDAFTFLQKYESKTFMEAVENLASRYGLELPKRQGAQKATAQNKTIYTAMEEAKTFYLSQKKAVDGFAQARGLSSETAQTFQLGFAPNANDALYRTLKERGFSDRILMDAGLISLSERTNKPYDRFRNRIIFPITSLKGQCIAFGGRAVDTGSYAKYLNSPETPIFHKGKTLYNLERAKKYLRDGHALIVAEGYMDVIALHQAGFKGVIAPLGTAITPEQLLQMWRFSDMPYIALDGDTAGKRAAEKLALLALEHIKPGKTLSFAFLPAGQDPDDLVRQENGKQAFQAVLQKAAPLSDVVWDILKAPFNFEMPESRAAFDVALKKRLETIKDTDVQKHYRALLYDKRRDLFYNKKQQPQTNSFSAPTPPPSSGLTQEVLLVGYVMAYPELLSSDPEAFVEIDFSSQECRTLQQEVLKLAAEPDTIFEAKFFWQHIEEKYTQFLKENAFVKRVLGHKSNIPIDEVRYFYIETLQTHKKLTLNRHELENARVELCSEHAVTASHRLNTLVNTPMYSHANTHDMNDAHYTEKLKKIFDDKVWLKDKSAHKH